MTADTASAPAYPAGPATGFIYVHTPLEFAEGESEPDPKTGTVYYWARMWFVTCKHCIPESGVVAVRLNTRTGGTRIDLFGSEQWTLHPSEDVAVCPLGLGHESRGNEEVAADIENLEFESISDKLTAGKAQILKTGFYESTPAPLRRSFPARSRRARLPVPCRSRTGRVWPFPPETASARIRPKGGCGWRTALAVRCPTGGVRGPGGPAPSVACPGTDRCVEAPAMKRAVAISAAPVPAAAADVAPCLMP